MVWHTDRIYDSSNGDTWDLLREAPGGRILVRHTANRSSGGHVSDTPVEDFLAMDGSGPERRALRVLLTKLARPN